MYEVIVRAKSVSCVLGNGVLMVYIGTRFQTPSRWATDFTLTSSRRTLVTVVLAFSWRTLLINLVCRELVN